MPNTPVQGLPYPALSDPANGPVAFQNLATALEDYKTVVRCTSSTRPAHVEGRHIYETDTDRVLISDGTNWVAWDMGWTVFSPVVAGLTLGTGGSKGGRYKLMGRTCFANFWVSLGTGFTITNNSSSLAFTLPVTAQGDAMNGNAFSMFSATWNIPGVNAFFAFGYVGGSQCYVGTINNLNGYMNPVTPTNPPLNASTILNVNCIYQTT